MKEKNFIKFIKNKKLDRLRNLRISTNSKGLNKGTIFIGIKGKTFNGSDFADEALNKGAKLAILQGNIKLNKKKIKVKSTLELLNKLSHKHQKV